VAEKDDLLILSCTCGQKMKVPPEAQGKVYKCVRCGEHIQVQATNVQPGPAGGGTAEPIGALLIERGIITQEQLAAALAEQRQTGGKTFEILIQSGVLSKDDLHAVLSRQPGIAAIDLSRFSVNRELLELIPKELAVDHLVLPIDRLGKLLTVAMACPLDAETLARLESITGLKVKAMLCRFDEIQAAVEKHYQAPEDQHEEYYSKLLKLSAVGGPRTRDLSAFVQKLQALPCARLVHEHVSTALARNTVDLRHLAELIAGEPALAAGVLQKANSPAYGLPGHVESVPMAVALLGAAGLRQAVREAQPHESPLLRQFARRAQRCAAAAAGLARSSGRVGPGLAASAGLLYEIGRHVLLAQDSARYSQVEPTLGGKDLATLERKQFSADHTEAGAELAVQWRFPEPLQAALRHQLQPAAAGPHAGLAAILHVAAALAAAENVNAAEAAAEACQEALQDLGIDRNAALQALPAA